MRELALLVAIATIPAEVQSVYEAGCGEQENCLKVDRVDHKQASLRSARGSKTNAKDSVYQNPIWNRDFPDPFVLAWDGEYYAYATETGVTGFQVMESRDLVKWTHKGVALKVPWSKRHYWAPEVVHYRGKFYMTYSAENPRNKKHDIGIAIASNPLGPFKHAAKLVEADTGQRGVIDATVFFESDGSPYIIYSEENPRSIVLRPMAADLLSVDEERVELIRPDREWERGVVEAPTILYRNGLYHLFYSAGPFQGSKANCNYCASHAVSKRLAGPYVKSRKPLLATVDGEVYGPGHQCLLTTADGQMWMFYHGWSDDKQPRYGSNPNGRTLRMDRLRWNGDDPWIDGPTLTRQIAPSVKAARVKVQAALAFETVP